MDFPKTVSIDSCEAFLAKLASQTDINTLTLPVGTASYAFGGLASAIQAVNSWSRQSNSRVLDLNASDVKDVVEDLIQRPHKFVAAMSAKSIAKADQSEFDLRPQVNAAAKSAIEEQTKHLFGQQRGGLCWFAFVDHSSKGFDRNFYIERNDSNPEPRQVAQINAVIKAMVGKAIDVAGGAKPLEGEEQDLLGRLFFELFLNTHEHGSRGHSRNEWLKPATRVIYVNAINLTETGGNDAIKKQPILTGYVDAAVKKYDGNKKKRFVEIGIVDAGLGYCERWLADHPSERLEANIPIDLEYKIFEKCFAFHQTSTNRDSKGNGLPIVLDRLSKLGGFMRVRSGRLSLYRDFLKSPFDVGQSPVFFDWNSGQLFSGTSALMPPAVGVAITLLIPLEAK